MADEFHAAGICGGTWWDTSRSSFSTPPCTAVLSSFKIPARSTSSDEDDDLSASVCDNSIMGFREIIRKPHPVDSGSLLMDSTLQMLGFGLSSSSSTSDWNSHDLLHGNERTESNYSTMLQEERSTAQIQTTWNSKNFGEIGDEDLNIGSFSMGSENNNNSYNYNSSSVVQSLFETDDHNQSIFNSNYQTPLNYSTAPNDFLPSWSKLSQNFDKPLTPKHQQANHLQFSNNMPFWNPTTVNTDIRANYISSQNSQFVNSSYEEKPNCTKPKNDLQVSSARKTSNEPAFKRQRFETPSPLPTFKVRKEKLGDRITALQQLVSPFGKTDTASVLHEAIEYIKFLHDQVNVLSTPYMKNATQNASRQPDLEGTTKQDLKNLGLCLVPISSTYPVANETTADFWTPTFGGTFR